MRFIAGILCIAVCITACRESPSIAVAAATSPVLWNTASVEGTYTGNFKGSPITIVFNYVTDKRVSGYNIHKGLKRNINGSIRPALAGLYILASEPGSNEYDGTFVMLLDTANGTLTGKWASMNRPADSVSFVLYKQKNSYIEWSEGYFTDSLNNLLEFRSDGSCLLKELIQDSLVAAQQVFVNGSYRKDNDSVISVFWQPNPVFPSRKSIIILRQLKDEEGQVMYQQLLFDNGRVFFEDGF